MQNLGQNSGGQKPFQVDFIAEKKYQRLQSISWSFFAVRQRILSSWFARFIIHPLTLTLSLSLALALALARTLTCIAAFLNLLPSSTFLPSSRIVPTTK